MTRDALLAHLAERVLALARPHPLRVAIDGVVAAGKTTLGDELAPLLAARGRAVIRSGIDHFHRPRALRYARGRASARGYYEDSFDHERLEALLLGPLGPGGDRRFRRHGFDHRQDAAVEEPWEHAPADAILVFDGVFLQRPELRAHWDFAIFLDVPFDETHRRAVLRDGAGDDPDDLWNRRYVAGQQRYLDACRPAERAQLVVDNRDVARPRVVRDGAPG